MKNILYCFLLVVSFLSKAYSQSTCENAVEVFPTGQPVTIAENLKQGSQYYKFKATATACRIDVKQTNATILIRFYSLCDSSFLQASSESTFIQGGLKVGKTYYYETYSYNVTAPASYTQTLIAFNQTANDVCGGAIELTPVNIYTGTAGNFNGATPSGARYEYTPDVWYKFKATSRAVRVEVKPSGFSNTTIEIFDSCGADKQRTLATGNILIQGGLKIGKTYYYRFYGNISPLSASYTTAVVALSSSPINDECDGAIEVTPQLTFKANIGEFTNATASLPSRGKDLWFKFKASTNAAIIRMKSTEIRADIMLYANCSNKKLATGIEVDSYKEVRLGGLIPSQTYYYKIESNEYPDANGSFTHAVITIPNTVANDECSDAYLVTPTNIYTPILGDFKNATPSLYTVFNRYDSSACNDVWYKFVATAKAMTISVKPSNALIGIQLHKYCGGAAYSSSYSSVGTISLFSGGFVIGQTYYYKVYAKEVPTETSSFTHSVSPVSDTPMNDDCENAQMVVPATTINWTIGTLKNATGSFGDFRGFDIWFKFVATSTSATIHQENCNLEPYAEAFDGCKGAIISRGYNDPLLLNSLIVGKTYYYLISNGMGRCYLSDEIKTAVLVESSTNTEQIENLISKIYPNPSRGSLTITNGAAKLTNVKIYNMSGLLFTTVSSTDNIIIENLPQGIYFVQISDNNNTRTEKIVVQ